MLVLYHFDAQKIADPTNAATGPPDSRVAQVIAAHWKTVGLIDGMMPLRWKLADQLVANGAEGALVPSAQNPGAGNLVLRQWHELNRDEQIAVLTILKPADMLTPLERGT